MKLINILKEIKIQQPIKIIPKEKWYDEFSNCNENNIYEITYQDFDSGEIVKNKITEIDFQNDAGPGYKEDEYWWLNCSILEYKDEEDWQEEHHPQIFSNDIKEVIKIK